MSDFSTSRVVRARKSHTCEECGRTIEPGEDYDRYAGVWEGDFYTFVSCRHCLALRRTIEKADPHWESSLGGIDEWFYQGMIRETATTFEDGLRLARLRLQFTRRWRKKDGALTMIPANP
jgi:hypothetical protein